MPDEDSPHVILQLITGLVIPGPDGQRGVLPAGAIKVPIGRQIAINKAKQLLETAETLPKPKPESDLVVAGSMDQVKRAAEMDKAFRSGPTVE